MIDPVERALKKLMSLHDGDRGVLDVMALGKIMIPRLTSLLFGRDPSGIFQPRCHVVEALAALGADDVLIAFIKANHRIDDPVENAGEEAVINAAARALRPSRDEHVFQLLLSLARERCLTGPIDVLGDFRLAAALPCLIDALGDDVARPASIGAIRKYGLEARTALFQAAGTPDRVAGFETETSRRRRRAVLSLLTELGETARLPSSLGADLMSDADCVIAARGCRLVLDCGTEDEKCAAVQRLIDLLPVIGWLDRRDIENWLMADPDIAAPLIAKADQATMPGEDDRSPEAAGRRVVARLHSQLGQRAGQCPNDTLDRFSA